MACLRMLPAGIVMQLCLGSDYHVILSSPLFFSYFPSAGSPLTSLIPFQYWITMLRFSATEKCAAHTPLSAEIGRNAPHSWTKVKSQSLLLLPDRKSELRSI